MGDPSPAKPGNEAPRPPAVVCPFCGSDDTERLGLFGSTSLTSQYHCRSCRSAFEQVKWGTRPWP
ncbi:MAG: hypothetical protein E6H02_01060 [Bacillati bacterium ANGP1]|uniref:PaaD zinc beta ribbon domain-containing protein n=1 Tax=Candidatus Segetimicrobium genomatis TaxID=2569760 RepID=A0A537M7K5_9BACT|nr:MAG: hypothetical protein E6H02_01060 [Terrabacteria group bacterium ANGP1]